MRNSPNARTLKFKQPDPMNGRVYSDIDGWYLIRGPLGAQLKVIASDGEGWDHVSVSLPNRTPTYEEMDFVRQLFFRDDEAVMQLHVPLSDHVNFHRFCLHLWRPQSVEIPRPPAHLVGPVREEART